MAVKLVNAYNLQNPVTQETVSAFGDLKDHWGEKFANTIVTLGISKGADNGWQPDRSITGAEVAQLVSKNAQLQGKVMNNLARKSKILNKFFYT